MKRSLAFIPLHLSIKQHGVVPTRKVGSSYDRIKHVVFSTIASERSDNNEVEKPFKHDYLDPYNTFIEKIRDGGLLAAARNGHIPEENRFHQPIVYHPNYSFKEWPEKQTFPMTKFYHLANSLLEKKGHLPRPLVRSPDDFFEPLNERDLPRSWFSNVISPKFLDRFLSSSLTVEEERRIGFRECCKMEQVKRRTILEVGGTILAAQLAYSYGLATNAAGGTHHADSEKGAGYTILNDLAVTANFLLDKQLNGGTIEGVKKVLVIDCDVHQGDGTAKFGPVIGDSLVTLSLHCASNYPTPKAESTYDVPLPDNMEDEEYMQVLMKSVNLALVESNPDFVLYDAGIDVHKDDFLGRLSLTTEGIRKRDRWVIETCVEKGIPVVCVIGGGYDKDPDKLARRHSIVHEEAAFVWRKYNLWKNRRTL